MLVEVVELTIGKAEWNDGPNKVADVGLSKWPKSTKAAITRSLALAYASREVR